MARPRVLITGFGAFPGVAENPSAWLAEMLAVQSPMFDAELHARVLPTAWQAARLIPHLCEELQPHVVIHFGVNERAKTLRLERFAHNRAARRPDADGCLPSETVVLADSADRFDTTLPAAALAAHLRTCGIAATASSSAGSYLCNFLYYHSLDWARRQPDPRHVLFVHIPPLGVLSRDALLLGANETLRFVLACVGAQRRRANGPAFAEPESMLSAKDS
jgi:pyroglutamyl-peptidase